MPARELRAEARIAVTRRGNLSSGENWFPCMIVDMSNHGFQMLCGRPVFVGQLLDFRCELFPDRFVNCRLEIRHASNDALGTKIVQIDERGQNLCQLFLQEQYAHKLERR